MKIVEMQSEQYAGALGDRVDGLGAEGPGCDNPLSAVMHSNCSRHRATPTGVSGGQLVAFPFDVLILSEEVCQRLGEGRPVEGPSVGVDADEVRGVGLFES